MIMIADILTLISHASWQW